MDPVRALNVGLVDVPTDELANLFRRLVRGELSFPLTRHALMALGYNETAAAGRVLIGLDERGARAVLVAVLAERKARGG